MRDYLIGRRLDEYRIEALLGRGGMARVYRAVDVNLNRLAAIKVIDTPYQDVPGYLERFRREAQAIARLDHPHIVRLYRYGEVDGLLYMAMQFIHGVDLQFILNSYRQEGQRIEAWEARRIIREVCEALDYAHHLNIIHRDVKPSNIMLDRQGRAILTDFGLALLSTQATRGEVLGSPHYAAPEQVQSSARAVAQSDLYSLGVVLYEMFAGRRPFHSDDPFELAQMQVHQAVTPPSVYNPGISPELEGVILKALEKQPEDRFSSGWELAEALERALPVEGLPPAGPTLLRQVTTRLSGAGSLAGPTLPAEAPEQASLLAEGDTIQAAAYQGGEAGPTAVAWDGREREDTAATMAGEGIVGSAPAVAAPLPRRRLPGRAGLTAAALALALCLCLAGALLIPPRLRQASQAATARRTQTAQVQVGDPATVLPDESTALPSPTLPAALPPTEAPPAAPQTEPTTAPAPSPTAIHYTVAVQRQGEAEAFLVIFNPGGEAIPLGNLRLVTDKKVELALATWGVEALQPGECLLARKANPKGKDPDPSMQCTQVGQTLGLEKKQEDLFKGKMQLYAGEELLGTCEKDEKLCAFGN